MTMFKAILAGVLAFGFLGGSLAGGALIDWTDQTNRLGPWRGFGPDFQPDWTVDTTVVKTTPAVATTLYGTGTSTSTWYDTGAAATISFSTATYAPDWNRQFIVGWEEVPVQVQRSTVNRLSSQAAASTGATAQYRVAGDDYDAYQGNSASGSESNTAQFAHAAVIETDQGDLLATASTIAHQNARFDAHSFTASGRVSAIGDVRNGAESSGSNAWADSSFAATYQLERDTPFSLSLDMARYDNVDLVFSVVDSLTGNTVWSATPRCDHATAVLEANGVLAAGEYTFSLEAAAQCVIGNDQLLLAPGMATYDVSLDLAAEDYWVTVYEKRPIYAIYDAVKGVPVVQGGSGAILLTDFGVAMGGCMMSTISDSSIVGRHGWPPGVRSNVLTIDELPIANAEWGFSEGAAIGGFGPVPEPSALAFILALLAASLCGRRRRG